jgi:hypothetical protein
MRCSAIRLSHSRLRLPRISFDSCRCFRFTERAAIVPTLRVEVEWDWRSRASIATTIGLCHKVNDGDPKFIPALAGPERAATKSAEFCVSFSERRELSNRRLGDRRRADSADDLYTRLREKLHEIENDGAREKLSWLRRRVAEPDVCCAGC